MEIGKRKQVDSIKEIWPKETLFSAWLASEDGLELLAEDLGVEMESPQLEFVAGNFPCDIVGHMVGDEGHTVIVENQYGKTNHDHLGKLLTYASANSATTAIWIAESVSDDHRKVIDWLNDNTPPSVSFYLAQLKAYRIGDSLPAPQLDVVCRPNLQVKLDHEKPSNEGGTAAWCKAQWDDILSYMKEQKPSFHVPKSSAHSWVTFSAGKQDFHVRLSLSHTRKKVSCELILKPSFKDSAWEQLMTQRDQIESELRGLEWHELPDNKSARITASASLDPKDDSKRTEIREWLFERAGAFSKTFIPRVKALIPGSAALIEFDESDDEDEVGPPDSSPTLIPEPAPTTEL